MLLYDTQSRIKYGLIKALEQKPLYDLKDLDVIKNAEVANATFYKYYANKIVLLKDVEASLLAELKKALAEDLKVWYHPKHSLSKKDIARLVENGLNNTLDFFDKYHQELLVLTSNNGDPVLRHTLVDVVNQRLVRILKYYFNIYEQEGMLAKKPKLFDYVAYRWSNEIIDDLLYWIINRSKMTFDDAKQCLSMSFTQSVYEIVTHGFN
ncbi:MULTISPECIES: hypothetical protein [Lactobacillus]|uniref:TetR family transcriptional regulator n=1 Tax=Lactobacillus xujianguonis TaxID=2495899 RepID=A0A437SX77_9LACO|nr:MULTISPECIES: hypothetical protein [Lactobacillus]RVU71519.1 hypothetical protein EJK17_02120 [Lactobacillus xujianguonis]RVU76706.1 hypothetical protein EJK20_04280 [Lactobacillus xujianguonis]